MCRFLAVFLFLLVNATAFSQDDPAFLNRPRYPDGLLSVRASGGFTKYSGEFVDNSLSSHLMFGAVYNFIPEFSAGVGLDFGKAAYSRRSRLDMGELYQYQFGSESEVPRTTWYSTFDVECHLNLFPRQYLNAYLLLGGGVTLFGPQDYRQDGAQVRPDADVLGAFTLPVGLGLDYFIDRHLAVNLELRHSFLFTDRFDAFPSDDVTNEYNHTNGVAVYAGSASPANDAISTVSFGLNYFLFENDDPDGDLLPNEEEEAIGSNPYDADTDGDGLSDYLEQREHRTSPLLADSDEDGLSDREEISVHHTNPLSPDSDGDGVADRVEVEVSGTDPLAADTDVDSVPDARELALGSDPRAVDSDKDGLSDAVELEVYHTSLVIPDTDADRLSDYAEITAHKTNPKLPDTDNDQLTDGEEVLDHHTNPLAADTDGDTISDYAETRGGGSDPLLRDTDSDGIADGVDRCPRLPEYRTRKSDADGCPDRAVASESKHRPKARRSSRVLQLVSDYGDEGAAGTAALRDGIVIALPGIHFAPGRDVVLPDSKPVMERLAGLFSEYPLMEAEVRGYAELGESAGSDEELSLDRAKAVHRFLVSRGVRTERLLVRGFGARMPSDAQPSIDGRNRDCRIELRILKLGPESEKQLPMTSDDDFSSTR